MRREWRRACVIDFYMKIVVFNMKFHLRRQNERRRQCLATVAIGNQRILVTISSLTRKLIITIVTNYLSHYFLKYFIEWNESYSWCIAVKLILPLWMSNIGEQYARCYSKYRRLIIAQPLDVVYSNCLNRISKSREWFHFPIATKSLYSFHWRTVIMYVTRRGLSNFIYEWELLIS